MWPTPATPLWSAAKPTTESSVVWIWPSSCPQEVVYALRQGCHRLRYRYPKEKQVCGRKTAFLQTDRSPIKSHPSVSSLSVTLASLPVRSRFVRALLLLCRLPSVDRMVILTRRIAPDFEDHSTDARATPADCAVLLRGIVLLINEVRLVEISCAPFRLTPCFRLTARLPAWATPASPAASHRPRPRTGRYHSLGKWRRHKSVQHYPRYHVTVFPGSKAHTFVSRPESFCSSAAGVPVSGGNVPKCIGITCFTCNSRQAVAASCGLMV